MPDRTKVLRARPAAESTIVARFSGGYIMIAIALLVLVAFDGSTQTPTTTKSLASWAHAHNITVRCEKLQATPTWSGVGEPPRSVGSALEHARDAAAQRAAEWRDAELGSIGLESGCDPSHWYYVVILRPWRQGLNSGQPVAVLMDGTTLLPDPR